MPSEARLGEDVRLVIFQFIFSNPDAVPEEIRRRPRETHGAHVLRKERASGVQCIAPVEQIDIFEAVDGITLAAYELVDVFCEERIAERSPCSMVRFTFARQGHATPKDGFLAERQIHMEKLREMCRAAFWRVRAFRNPFFRDGEAVLGVSTMSVNLEARVPRFQGDGAPVVRYAKDEHGRRIGDRPLPIGPKGKLLVEGDELRIAV